MAQIENLGGWGGALAPGAPLPPPVPTPMPVSDINHDSGDDREALGVCFIVY